MEIMYGATTTSTSTSNATATSYGHHPYSTNNNNQNQNRILSKPPPPPPSRPQPQYSHSQSFPPNPHDVSSSPEKKQKQQQQKEEKQQQQQQQQYSCIPCSVTFSQKSALQAHLSSHIICPHPNCNFTGSKKVVNGHFQSSHGKYSGRGLKNVSIQFPGKGKGKSSSQEQRFKICVGSHPEDIKAWIAERKKKFPTRERVREKREQHKRRREEGRGMESESERNRDSISAAGSGSGSGSGNLNSGIHHQSKKLKVTNEIEVEAKKPSSALGNLVNCYGSSSDEDEEKEELKPSNPLAGTNIASSSDASKDEATAVAVAAAGPPSSSPSSIPISISSFKTKQCRFFLRNGTCKNGDNCTYIHDMSQYENFKAGAEDRKKLQSHRDRARNEARNEMNVITRGKNNASGSSFGGSSVRGGGSGGETLLRKLLQNDIRRERSLALQLLRYVVDCNFLQDQKEVVPECINK